MEIINFLHLKISSNQMCVRLWSCVEYCVEYSCVEYSLIIDDIVLFILYTALSKFLTRIVDTFSEFWSSWASISSNNSFANSLLKASTKAVWVCLFFVVALRISALCFSSNFATSPLNSPPLSHWNTSGYLKSPQMQPRLIFWF